MNSYNNAIQYLNNEANKYLNTDYADRARCVGSVPDNPNYDAAEMFTSNYGYMSSYNGKFKGTDNNHSTDLNKMSKLEILDIDEFYWFASRQVSSGSSGSLFNVRHLSVARNIIY